MRVAVPVLVLVPASLPVSVVGPVPGSGSGSGSSKAGRGWCQGASGLRGVTEGLRSGRPDSRAVVAESVLVASGVSGASDR
ncbi:hypothetical protein [Streptomyces sp. 15-116A]|uniref:hypothetical protein n=1 Tax=Streptomyces sp. 15-116A TaxID=2259035 RepID=UPI0021B192FA|nr:hypothetical protein [Streptomyces sp. 15-116A]